MDEKVTASVAVVLLGESPGVKEGGTLDHVHRELTIQALPDNIPPQIEVDISELAIGDSVKIGDLSFPDVVIEGPPDDPVVMIRVSHVHVIEEPEVEGEEEAEGAEEEESSAEETSESAE
jgi:large subunit ribosomal protein L25